MDLIISKQKCSACGACMQTCAKDAIQLKPDEYGFLYPIIDDTRCVDCGACKLHCHYHHPQERNSVISTYASMIKDESIKRSSSGGVFVKLAESFIQNGGVVIGCAMNHSDDCVYSEHIVVSNVSDLHRLQGSKYVQSRMGDIYKKTKTLLKKEVRVLFSGTPCQIAGLKAYLCRDYLNLYLVDVICHGVPNEIMFNGYLKKLSEKIKGKIYDYKFRDKELDWGINMRAFAISEKGEKIEKVIPPEDSSFFRLFLSSHITRESCIGCCYADANRLGDITLGDYWGIHYFHPEESKTKFIDNQKGVSAVLVNSPKGEEMYACIKKSINSVDSKFTFVQEHNSQVVRPVTAPFDRDKALESFKVKGYEGIEEFYYQKIGLKKYFYKIKNFIPRRYRVYLKKLIGK